MGFTADAGATDRRSCDGNDTRRFQSRNDRVEELAFGYRLGGR
jgi:hypothetical protein